jgi:hypothetical protein
MEETKAKPRGRPRGAKDKSPRVVKAAAPNVDLAGNGRDEAAYEPLDPRLASETDDGISPSTHPAEPPKLPVRPTFPNLFIHTVENGYIIRPAYPQGDRLASTDVRTWIVPTREALAALIVALMAVPRLEQGTPQKLPQPGMFYSPPIIMETAAG